MSNVKSWIGAVEDLDAETAEQMLPMVYDDLRQLARMKLAQERPGQTLQATALVHEAFLRLANQPGGDCWDNPRHFFSAAAEAMRRILIERARRKKTLKRGGNRERVDLSVAEPQCLPLRCDDLLGLDEALSRLELKDPRKAELVKLRFFAGLTMTQAAHALGVSVSTAENDWAYARAWLRLEMSDPLEPTCCTSNVDAALGETGQPV